MKLYQYINEVINFLDKGYMRIDPNGIKEWRDEQGNLHRDNEPARIFTTGTKEWYQHGFMYNPHGPAKIWSSGQKDWRDKQGNLHRDNDLPAIICPWNQQEWYKHGLRHRINGPAKIKNLEPLTKTEEWWYEGSQIAFNFPIPKKLQIPMIKYNPENIHKIINPNPETIKFTIENYPWILIDKDTESWPEDFKKQWSKIGKARKQIGL